VSPSIAQRRMNVPRSREISREISPQFSLQFSLGRISAGKYEKQQ
jgi:hypothetical protein